MSQLDPAVMANFTGTEQWYRHGMVRDILYTDGVKYVAETAGAYWLLDEIALVQKHGPAKVRKAPFQAWTLTLIKTGSGARLSCQDGNDNQLYSKIIPFTDFPRNITLWFSDNVILLPSEY